MSVQSDGAVAEARAVYTLARERVRRASGLRVLLALLHARPSMTAQASHALRTLAVKCLVGLAHDPALRHILSKLQVGLEDIQSLGLIVWVCILSFPQTLWQKGLHMSVVKRL